MSEQVKAYFKMLRDRSDEELDRSARALALREKQDVARLIAHIAEIGDRDYHLKLKYESLFEYCRAGLNLSEGSVYRRTQVAGVCRSFPQILEALSQGRLHLTAASLIAPVLTEENVENLITMAEGKSKREIEALLVTLAPKEELKPSIRKEPSRDRMAPEGATTEGKPPPPAGGQQKRTPDLLQPATEDRYNFRFSAGKAFTEKFKRLAEVLGVPCPHRDMEKVFEQALEIALDKKDPKRRLERRRKRAAKKGAARPGKVAKKRSETQKKEETSGSPAVSRYVSPEVQERAFERAGYQCEYRGPEGSRCSCRTGLQVEHVMPFAVYQTHDERYLRAYCPAHNLLAAKKFYGREFIQRKIDAARSERGERSGAG